MNGYHQLALFVVLFGGFLGWGLALDYREWLKTHVFGEVPFRPKFTGWLKSLLPPKNWDYWVKRVDREYLLNLPMIQSVDFAMNIQTMFNRPQAGIPWIKYVEWSNLKKMEKERKRAFDLGFQSMALTSPSIRYAWETDEMWLKRTGGFPDDGEEMNK